MQTEIIVAIITGCCAVIGQYIISARNKSAESAERILHEAEENSRLKAIESRLDTHNAYAKKFDDVSKSMSDINVSLAGLKKDVEYLKEMAEK